MEEAQKHGKSTKKKIIAALTLAIMIALIALLAVKVCVPMVRMAEEPEQFREYMAQRGLKGIVLFVFVTAMQVIAAVIPGGPLEVAAGYCFGPVRGALIADIGMTLGSMAVFLLVRRFGMDFIEIFVPREKVESLKFLKTNGQSRMVIFLLFLIPGAPKDVIAYGIGLTDLSLAAWLFITAVGRFPSILLSAMSGDALMDQSYGRFIAVIAVIAVTALAGGILYRVWMKKQK